EARSGACRQPPAVRRAEADWLAQHVHVQRYLTDRFSLEAASAEAGFVFATAQAVAPADEQDDD
ncbi:MAG: hypothetical protein QM692_04005, partial [Thermomicrobiales bacterium]